MTVVELARLVAAMRVAQKKAYRTASACDVVVAMHHEKQVDEALREVLSQLALPLGEWTDTTGRHFGGTEDIDDQ